MQDGCVPATLAADPLAPLVFALRENLVIGSLRDYVPSLLRVLLTATAVLAGTQSVAALELIIYEATGVVTSVDPLSAMPVKANVGDQFRFRAVVNGGAPPIALPPNSSRASYGSFREVSFWLNDTPLLAPANPQASITVYNDDSALGQPRDWFFLRWRKPLNGLTLYFDLEIEDSINHSMFQSTALPEALDFTQANRAEMWFFLELGINYGVVRMRMTSFSVSREWISTLPPLSSATPFGPEPWRAAATSSQVPNAAADADERRINAAFWVNSFGDVATLEFAEQGSAGVNRVTLRCAPAGATGPALWTTDLSNGLSGRRFLLVARDLTPVGPSANCPFVINNVASLQAAAEQRLLYLELERSGPPLRGQLWPRSFGLQDSGFGSMATTSDQQVVTASPQPAQWLRAPVTLWFSEFNQTLARLGYSVPNRHRFRNVNLHCAPPGQDGPVVAQLPSIEGVLTLTDIRTVDASSACGIAVNNHASLLEALARGNLYAVVELADPPGVNLRGQFPAPGNGELP